MPSARAESAFRIPITPFILQTSPAASLSAYYYTTQRPAYTPASSSVTSAACCLLDFLFQPTPFTFPSSSYLATHPGARIVGTRTVTGSDSEAGRLPAHPHNSSRLTLHTRSRSLSGLPLKKPPACIQAYIFLMFLSLIQLHKSSHQTSNRWRYIWS